MHGSDCFLMIVVLFTHRTLIGIQGVWFPNGFSIGFPFAFLPFVLGFAVVLLQVSYRFASVLLPCSHGFPMLLTWMLDGGHSRRIPLTVGGHQWRTMARRTSADIGRTLADIGRKSLIERTVGFGRRSYGLIWAPYGPIWPSYGPRWGPYGPKWYLFIKGLIKQSSCLI